MELEPLEIMMNAEETFSVTLTDDRLGHPLTYGELVNLVVEALREQNPASRDPKSAVHPYLRDTLFSDSEIRQEDIVSEAQLYCPKLGLGRSFQSHKALRPQNQPCFRRQAINTITTAFHPWASWQQACQAANGRDSRQIRNLYRTGFCNFLITGYNVAESLSRQ
jgi:hypothetical protein